MSRLRLQRDDTTGQTLGKYQLLCRLAVGGMSELFLGATRSGPSRLVAIKRIREEMRGDDNAVRLFLDEARRLAELNHPNIARILDLDREGKDLYLAMEFLSGASLLEIASEQELPVGFALTVARDVALALHYAHTFVDATGRPRPVIHRDVAEKNVMVTFEGVTKLLDFGIAKRLTGPEYTKVGVVIGTLAYMSPEQLRGETLDARSDIYSLGVTLYETLTGKPPFETPNVIEQHRRAEREAPRPPSSFDEALAPVDAVVLKALRGRREERFQTAREASMTL